MDTEPDINEIDAVNPELWREFDEHFQHGKIPFNDYLPYAKSLPGEAKEQFQNIKRGLSDIIVLQEFDPGVRFWCKRIDT